MWSLGIVLVCVVLCEGTMDAHGEPAFAADVDVDSAMRHFGLPIGKKTDTISADAAIDTGSSEEMDYQPKEGWLPDVSSWSDALSGHIDGPSQVSCEHIRAEIIVEEERFKANTKRALEAAYSPGVVTAMENTLKAGQRRLDNELQMSGCGRETQGGLSAFGSWVATAKPGLYACERLLQKRSSLAKTYQKKVQSMMLKMHPRKFVNSVETLYKTTQNLHLRLRAQGCEGPPETARHVSPAPVLSQSASSLATLQGQVSNLQSQMSLLLEKLQQHESRMAAARSGAYSVPLALWQEDATVAESQDVEKMGSDEQTSMQKLKHLQARVQATRHRLVKAKTAYKMQHDEVVRLVARQFSNT
jgi:hypothetical protein